MKSKILLTSMAAILASVAGANALEYKPFVGLTMGLANAIYSDETEDAEKAQNFDLPEDFIAFGIEAGVRFGAHNEIYNYGFTLNADTSTERSIEQKFGSAKLGDMTTTYYSATFDNYFRMSGDKNKRIDLVLGAGLGSMNYHVDLKNGYDDTVYSPVVALKIGVDFEVSQSWTLSANTRFFVPTRSHYELDSSYIVGGAVKYMF